LGRGNRVLCVEGSPFRGELRQTSVSDDRIGETGCHPELTIDRETYLLDRRDEMLSENLIIHS